MIYLPIIGALLEASGLIIEKKLLKNKKLNHRNYSVFSFFAVVLAALPFVYFNWRVDDEALRLANLGIFAAVIVISVAANLLIFYALKRESIGEFEPIWMTQPLFIILLASLIFSSERNFVFIIPALIASISLVLMHMKKEHFYFDKYMIAALLGSFCFAVELVTSRFILEYYSSFSFYFLRCVFIFLIAALIYRPSVKVIDKKMGLSILGAGVIWVLYRAIVYYGYIQLGIVFTTLLFILAPVFMLLFAVIFLKEKVSLKQIILTGIILACVVSAVLLG